MKSKIGMLLGAIVSVGALVLSPTKNSPVVVANGVIDFMVMIICYIIWSSVCTDEDREEAKRNKYFKGGIVSNYVVAAMINCVAAYHGNPQYRVLIYISYMAVFISFAMMFWTFGMYLLKNIEENSRNASFYKLAYHILTGIHLLLILSTPISKLYFYVDEMGVVQYPYTYSLADIYVSVMLVLYYVWIVRNAKNRQEKKILLSCVLAWGIGALGDTMAVVDGIGLFSTDAILGLLFSVGILWIFCGIYSKQRHDFLKQKEELTNLRLNAMIGQIEPHFIFNTLGTIDSLCVEDTDRARTVIGMFSDYLRANYQSIKLHPMCTINQEIENLKIYTQIEQIRFSRLNICYEVGETEFMIPRFTLQPLVENAIKHGICMKKRSEGTVTIRTFSDEKDYIILVSDDGVGFDQKYLQDGNVHVGIQNVEQRLNILCGGKLMIDSKVGSGTTCTIRVPKEYKVM